MSEEAKTTMAGEDRPLIELEPTQKRMLTIALLCILTLILFFNASVKAVGSNIVSDLGDASLFGFMNTLFFLGSTCMMPISTKIGDKYGRKPIISVGVALYTLSLLVAGTTHSMLVHLIARICQGLGQGCMLANTLAFIGEINSKQEKNSALGTYAVITGVANIIAPLAGGALADALNWRYTCWTAVPFGVIVFLLVMKYMPKRIIKPETKIDVAGAICIFIGVSALILYMSFGAKYGFTSSFGITMIVLFLVGLIGLIVIEKKAEAPCLDFSLYKNKSFLFTILAVIGLAPSMYGTGSYISNYAMAVKGMAATWSASFTSINSIGTLVMASIYTAIASKMEIKKLCIFDAILFTINILLMITLKVSTPIWLIVLTVVIQGARTAIYMPAFTTSLQTDMDKKDAGTATANVQFMQGLAGTLGLSVLGMCLNGKFNSILAKGVIPDGLLSYTTADELKKFLGSTYLMSNKAADVAAFRDGLAAEGQPLFDQLIANVRSAYASGLSFAYTILLVLCIIGLISSFLMMKYATEAKKEA